MDGMAVARNAEKACSQSSSHDLKRRMSARMVRASTEDASVSSSLRNCERSLFAQRSSVEYDWSRLLVLRTAGMGSSRECLVGVKPATLGVIGVGEESGRGVHAPDENSSLVLLGGVALELEAYS